MEGMCSRRNEWKLDSCCREDNERIKIIKDEIIKK